MRGTVIVYFVALVSALALFGAASQLQPGLDSVGVTVRMIRFLLLAAGGAAALTFWGAAVFAASCHRVSWLLFVAAAIVIGTLALLALAHGRAP